MKKIIIVLLAVSSSVLFAGGGGGGGKAFGGEYNEDKYANSNNSDGIIYIPDTANSSCDMNIKVTTHSSVRYRSWIWYVHTWKSGYATTTVTQCGKPVAIQDLEITQFSYSAGSVSYTYKPSNPQYNYGEQWNKDNPNGALNYIMKEGSTSEHGSNYIKLGLEEVDETGTVVTIHHFKTYYKPAQQTRVSNKWGPGDLNFEF